MPKDKITKNKRRKTPKEIRRIHNNPMHDQIMAAINSPWEEDYDTPKELYDYLYPFMGRDRLLYPQWFGYVNKGV